MVLGKPRSQIEDIRGLVLHTTQGQELADAAHANARLPDAKRTGETGSDGPKQGPNLISQDLHRTET